MSEEIVARPGEVVVTPEMVKAGLDELRQHHYDTDVPYMLECVFRAMAYESPAASSQQWVALGNPWQDISTAPRDGTEMLLYAPRDGFDDDDEFIVVGFWEDHYWNNYAGGPGMYGFTHWMPLPTPPCFTASQ